MDDYIKRETLLTELSKGTIVTDDIYGMGIMTGLGSAIRTARKIPAADVAPVVHGKWLKVATTGTDIFGEPTEVIIACNCSVCGLDGREETDFCPHCGARMDGEFD